jgi:hypothetical protein
MAPVGGKLRFHPTCAAEGTEPAQVLGREPAALRIAPPEELAPLLRYLAVDHRTFTAHERTYFDRLAVLLRRAGALGSLDRLDRASHADAVRAFQDGRGLAVDGIPGQETCWALQRDWALARRLEIVPVGADRVPGSAGHGWFELREDIVDAYEGFRAAVRSEGGVVTSAGAFRRLSGSAPSGHPPTSMHYVGLAFDLALDTGMQDPGRDRYLVEEDAGRWRVWCRSPHAPERTIRAVTWRGGKLEVRPVRASALDFTEFAEQFGFSRVGPRSSFPEDYLSAGWWHFQLDVDLVPWVSQFGIELLSLERYDEPSLSSTEAWRYHARLFQRGEAGWW